MNFKFPICLCVEGYISSDDVDQIPPVNSRQAKGVGQERGNVNEGDDDCGVVHTHSPVYDVLEAPGVFVLDDTPDEQEAAQYPDRGASKCGRRESRTLEPNDICALGHPQRRQQEHT